MPDSRRYDDEDVQAIIQGALKQQGTATGDLTHADLLSVGEQVGLPAEAIERAAHAVLEARCATQATQRVTSSRRRWLAAHAAVFAVIHALLFTVNALTSPGEWWFLFSLFFWGLALGAHAAFALGAGVSSKEIIVTPALKSEKAENRGRRAPEKSPGLIRFPALVIYPIDAGCLVLGAGSDRERVWGCSARLERPARRPSILCRPTLLAR